jgi:hypothetical protein
MSIGPLGAVGTPLAQTKGTGPEHVHGEIGAEHRRVHSEQKADVASGVAQPDGEDHQSAGRNADGRRPWEQPPSPAQDPGSRPSPQSKDPSQQSGNLLDLDG